MLLAPPLYFMISLVRLLSSGIHCLLVIGLSQSNVATIKCARSHHVFILVSTFGHFPLWRLQETLTLSMEMLITLFSFLEDWRSPDLLHLKSCSFGILPYEIKLKDCYQFLCPLKYVLIHNFANKIFFFRLMVIEAKVIASSLGATVSITFHKARGSKDCVLSRRRPRRLEPFQRFRNLLGYSIFGSKA